MSKAMIPVTILIASVALGALALAAKRASGAGPDDPVARGEYLVHAMGCADCHTPWKMGPSGPEQDMTRWLSGHPSDLGVPAPREGEVGAWEIASTGTWTAWTGPWGTSFTANLTPDRETGLGDWTLQQFVDTVRTGRHQGRGREILPPMPYFNVAKLTDDDLAAVFAYLRSIPAIVNRVPQPVPPAAD